MKLTKEKAHKLCRAMWLEIARKKLTSKSESSVLNWYNKKYNTSVDSDCFACEYYYKLKNGNGCPLMGEDYGDGCVDSCCYSGPFYEWFDNGRDPKYALKIAELFRRQK